MNRKTILITFTALLLTIAQAGLVFGQPAKDTAKPATDANSAGGLSSLVGSWYLTGSSEISPDPFRGLLTFAEGGGVVASAQGDVLLDPPPGVPAVATAAHGAWVRTANREYLFTFRQIYYNGDGSYAGGAKVRNVATINTFGTTMTGRLIVQYYDENDALVFTGTGAFTAVPIVAERLTP